MVSLAVEFRQGERNTFVDFNQQPNVDRNSVYCQKAPKSSELKGLVQTQSPDAPANLFFDPKVKTNGSNVILGTARTSLSSDRILRVDEAYLSLDCAANTIPFGLPGSAFDNSTGQANMTALDGVFTSSSLDPSSASETSASTKTKKHAKAPKTDEGAKTVFVTVTAPASSASSVSAADASVGAAVIFPSGGIGAVFVSSNLGPAAPSATGDLGAVFVGSSVEPAVGYGRPTRKRLIDKVLGIVGLSEPPL